MQFRERAAHGFQLESEIIPHLLARHAQAEHRGREPARAQPLRQVEQERGEFLFRAHRAEQQHHAMVGRDLAAHEPVELAHERRDILQERFELVERDEADLAVFERDGVAAVAIAADGIEPEDFAGHVEAVDLLVAGAGDLVGLEEARANGVQRFERVLHAIQVLPGAHVLPTRDGSVEPRQVARVHAERQAQLAQTARGADGF